MTDTQTRGAWAMSILRQCQPTPGDVLVLAFCSEDEMDAASNAWPGPCVHYGSHKNEIGAAIMGGRKVHAASSFGTTEEDFEPVKRELNEAVTAHLVNRNTMIVRGVEWSDLAFQNARKLPECHDIGELEGIAEGMPVFLVAPGPSLDVADVEEAQRHGLIICGQHSLHVLHRAGIRPDYVAAFEGRDVSAHFPDDPSMYKRLLLSLTSHPDLFDLPAERVYCTSAGNLTTARKMCEAIGYTHLPESGASVSTVCYAIAEMMRPSEIVLLGHDLAYTDGRVYAQGAFRSEARLVQDGERWHVERPRDDMDAPGAPETILDRVSIQMVEGVTGGTVPATPQMIHQRLWFERRCQASGAIQATNTSTGALISGMRNEPFGAVLARHPRLARLSYPKGGVLVDSNARKLRELARERETAMLRLNAGLEKAARMMRERPSSVTGHEQERALREAWDIAPHVFAAQLKGQVTAEGAAGNMDTVAGFARRVASQWHDLARELWR